MRGLRLLRSASLQGCSSGSGSQRTQHHGRGDGDAAGGQQTKQHALAGFSCVQRVTDSRQRWMRVAWCSRQLNSLDLWRTQACGALTGESS